MRISKKFVGHNCVGKQVWHIMNGGAMKKANYIYFSQLCDVTTCNVALSRLINGSIRMWNTRMSTVMKCKFRLRKKNCSCSVK